MLLLSDRSAEGAQLRQALASIGPCMLVALHQPAAQTVARDLLICDVALDNVTSVELLRSALTAYRRSGDVPMLMLARDPSQLTYAQAAALGATIVLPVQSPKTDILAAVKALVSGAPELPVSAPATIEADVLEAGNAFSDLLGAARRKKPISHTALRRGGQIVLRAVGQAKIRAWLDVVWTYDDLTYQHSLLVAGLVAALGQELGLTDAVQSMLSQAALVHDIGKAQIPLAILNKAGRLSAEETAVMRTHPARGYRMLAEQGNLDPRLLDVVLHHHEYLDGSGYPDRLRAQNVSRFVRLVTICDIYAALIERRSYKPPTSPDRALAHLNQMGRKLDGRLLKVFHTVVMRA